MFSIDNYRKASQRVDWGKQATHYQRGHEFVNSYHALYADNRGNDIGELIDRHNNLVQNYQPKGTKKPTSDRQHLQDALTTFELLLEDATGKDRKELQEAIDTFELLLAD